ncbi:MAG: hypothetical protein ABIU77_23965 [Ferruginibacter sp.]|jgi:hypothetical protein
MIAGTLGIGMPGGSEWIFIIIAVPALLISPILTIVFYTKNRELKRRLKEVTDEKNALLSKLLDK